jgi:hypothetical protein
VTIAGNQGQNVYPAPDNYPDTTFPQPVPAPTVDPDDAGTLITVRYSWEWQPVLLAAIDQLRNPATWQGDHDEIITALNRATDLKSLLQQDVSEVGTPFWDNETDVDDEEPGDIQPWYGEVTNPEAPAGELDFVENVALWIFTGLVAVATFEVAGIAPAIFFHTSVEKFIILQKRGDVAETIRFVVDGQDMKYVSTAPYAPGEIISTEIITPQTGGGHDLLIIGGSS